MAKRKAINQNVRFEIFKRDNFTCQYCGRKSPDVVLEIDHIKPVSKGGTNDLLNLVTSCFDCNRGKRDKTLNDNTALEKQRIELELLNERRKQIEMMLKWKQELLKQDDYIVDKICEYWTEVFDSTLTEYGRKDFVSLVKKYTFQEILTGIDEAFKSYQDDTEKALEMLPRVLARLKQFENKPYLKDLYYCRGILRNRLSYCNENYALDYLIRLYNDVDLPIEDIKEICLSVKNWTEFTKICESHLRGDECGR